MLFSSILFLFLALPTVLAVYFLIRLELRNTWLLIASLFFYAWGGISYLPVMLAVILMNYCFGLLVDKDRPERTRRVSLTVSVIANLVVLAGFKYADFLVLNLNILLETGGIKPLSPPGVTLPIGISFYTFQSMSYVIDVYRRDAEVERNPFRVGLYVALFPQLIAGPIVRYHDVANQIISRTITFDGFAHGVQRFIVGLGKKVLLANTFAATADEIFALAPHELSTPLAWLGIICYTLQIYYDFSGYSDMAIGLGHMFGFHFLENFQWPYISRSIREFWRRWHISLSTWFRDYLYLPLGGNRNGWWATARNLTIVFLLCGLWHGASWNFVIWGLYHGAFLVVERTRIGNMIERLPRAFGHVYVLLVVMVGWVFFRAETLGSAIVFLKTMAGIRGGSGAFHDLDYYLSIPSLWMALILGTIGAAPWLTVISRAIQSRPCEGPLRLVGSVACLAVLLLSVVVLASGSHNPFIYFRF